jgi:uncharacterized cupredoxin-like copper-binding protein
MAEEADKAKVDYGALVAEFTQETVELVQTLAQGNEQVLVRGFDSLGSAMIIKGAEIMLQAGAPPEFVLQRAAAVVKEFRTAELKTELENASKGRIILGA